MKTITTIDEAKAIKPGAYPVKGAVGVVFRKTADIPQRRGLQSTGLCCRQAALAQPWRPRPIRRSSPRCKPNRDKFFGACDEGEDPIKARRVKKGKAYKAPITFKQATAAFRAAYTPTLKGKYADQNWFNPIETHVFPVIGALPVNEIVGQHVKDIMNALDTKGLSKTALRLPTSCRRASPSTCTGCPTFRRPR